MKNELKKTMFIWFCMITSQKSSTTLHHPPKFFVTPFFQMALAIKGFGIKFNFPRGLCWVFWFSTRSRVGKLFGEWPKKFYVIFIQTCMSLLAYELLSISYFNYKWNTWKLTKHFLCIEILTKMFQVIQIFMCLPSGVKNSLLK